MNTVLTLKEFGERETENKIGRRDAPFPVRCKDIHIYVYITYTAFFRGFTNFSRLVGLPVLS